MEDYSLLVSGLEYKVRQLIEMVNLQSAENLEMKELLDSLRVENVKLKEQLDDVTRQKQIMEIAGYVETAKDPGKLKLKINEYIREIDKCIAYFSSQQ
jgi:FtsZ-binding cell division protein ZapB